MKALPSNCPGKPLLDGTLETFAGQPCVCRAAMPGEAWIEDGNKKLTVGRNTVDKVDGRRSRLVNPLDGSGAAVSLLNPYFLCGPQTDNYPSALSVSDSRAD